MCVSVLLFTYIHIYCVSFYCKPFLGDLFIVEFGCIIWCFRSELKRSLSAITLCTYSSQSGVCAYGLMIFMLTVELFPMSRVFSS